MRRGTSKLQYASSALEAVAAFAPTDLAGLALWLDAADNGSITLDGSNNVNQWNDKSGNGYHVAQTDTLRKPGFISGDGITYTSANHLLTNATSLNFSTGATIFIAYKPTDITGYTSVGGNDSFMQIGGYVTGTGSDGAAWGNYRLNKSAVADQMFSPPGVERIALNHRILQIYGNSTESFCKVIGTNTTSNTLGALSGGTGGTISVGSIGVSRAITIREIIVYSNGAMTSGNRTQVEDYLKARWS